MKNKFLSKDQCCLQRSSILIHIVGLKHEREKYEWRCRGKKHVSKCSFCDPNWDMKWNSFNCTWIQTKVVAFCGKLFTLFQNKNKKHVEFAITKLVMCALIRHRQHNMIRFRTGFPSFNLPTHFSHFPSFFFNFFLLAFRGLCHNTVYLKLKYYFFAHFCCEMAAWFCNLCWNLLNNKDNLFVNRSLFDFLSILVQYFLFSNIFNTHRKIWWNFIRKLQISLISSKFHYKIVF